jgi:hypothetical protein
MFRASSCPSSGEWYKIDNAYGVQHWLCCRRRVEKRWFGVHLLGMVSHEIKTHEIMNSHLAGVSKIIQEAKVSKPCVFGTYFVLLQQACQNRGEIDSMGPISVLLVTHENLRN